MLGFAVLMLLGHASSEKIYESVEVVSSYVTPIVKPNESKVEKPKHQQVTDIADTAKEVLSDSALSEESQITSPVRLLTTIKANRTESARRADYSGTSVVELVVGSSGEVREAKLANHLDHGLDDVALGIARDLKFKPAMVGTRAVATRVNLKIKFTSAD